MLAALLVPGDRALRVVDDLEVAAPGPAEVGIRITHSGVCHSDLAVIDRSEQMPIPVVLGHESAGVVERVGSQVSSLSEGDSVVLTAIASCGRCHACRSGHPTQCVQGGSFLERRRRDGTTGLRWRDREVACGFGVGGFSQRVVVPAESAIPIEATVPRELACLVGCAARTGVGAVINTASVPPGATVLVMGLGAIGLSIVQGARLAGASLIIGSDPVDGRRTAAMRCGASVALDPHAADVVSEARALTGGTGVDYAFDAVGSRDLVHAGVDATAPGGTTVLVGAGFADPQLSISAQTLVAEGKCVRGCTLGDGPATREIPRVLSLWRSGRLDLESLVTERMPLVRINDAVSAMRACEGIRTVIELDAP